MGQRIKGQEVEILSVVNGQPQDALNHVKSFSFTFKNKILEEGYLGQTSQEYDAIFDGIEGEAEFHFDSPAVLKLVLDIVNKARRREPGTQINIKCTMSFPSGARARIVILNAEFGPLPFNFNSRSDFGSFKISLASSNAQVLPL